MPYIVNNTTFSSDLYFTYMIFGISALIAGVVCIFIPYDTTNRELDLIEDKDSIDKSNLN